MIIPATIFDSGKRYLRLTDQERKFKKFKKNSDFVQID
jgi:hypothetical protein